MITNNNLQVLEDALLTTLVSIQKKIADDGREVMAVADGLTAFMSEEAREQCRLDATTCLMMSTEYPMFIDPTQVDEAVLRRSCRFVASLITQMLGDYNKYAVPLKVEFLFAPNYLGRLAIKWAHHVELLPEGQPV